MMKTWVFLLSTFLLCLPARATRVQPNGLRVQFYPIARRYDEATQTKILDVIECMKKDKRVSKVYSKLLKSGGGNLCVQFTEHQNQFRGVLLIQTQIRDRAREMKIENWATNAAATTSGVLKCSDAELTRFQGSDQSLDVYGEKHIIDDPCYKK